MKKVNIDGVPGLTLQGYKGITGDRGNTVYYNPGYVYDESDASLGIEYSVGWIDDDEDGVYDRFVHIPDSDPVQNDYLLYVSPQKTFLYRINKVDIKELSDANVKIIFGTTDNKEDQNTSGEEDNPTTPDGETGIKYVYILDYIDEWVFTGNDIEDFDIEIETVDRTVTYLAWAGSYERGTKKCNGHDIYKHIETDVGIDSSGNIIKEVSHEFVETVYDEYNYYKSDTPRTKNTIRVPDEGYDDPYDEEHSHIEEVDMLMKCVFVTFKVKTNLAQKYLKNLRVEVEFYRVENGALNIKTAEPSCMRWQLWLPVENESGKLANDLNLYPNGYAENYDHSMQFECREYPQDFNFVVKDFEDGANTLQQTYTATARLPNDFTGSNFDYSVFCYYRITPSSYKKIYITNRATLLTPPGESVPDYVW